MNEILINKTNQNINYIYDKTGSHLKADNQNTTISCGINISYGLTIAGINGDYDTYLNKYTSKELQTGEFDPMVSTGLEMLDFGSRFYDPQLGRWFTPDPAEQFANPYLAMGNNPVNGIDPDGEFFFLIPLAGITLSTVTITATSTVATIIGASLFAAAATTTVLATTSMMSASGAGMSTTAFTPPDGYLWDPSNPNQLQWQSFEGRSEGLDYITNTQTGETITRPMHTEFAKINPTGDLPGHFPSLSDPMRITYPLDRVALRPPSFNLSTTTASIQSTVASMNTAPGLGASVGGGFNPIGLAGASIGGVAAVGAHSYFDPKTNRWWSTSQQRYYNGNNFTGNQWTNNGMRGARGVSNAFRGVGYGLGALQYGSVLMQYGSGNMNDLQFALETGSSVYSTIGGIPGAAWGIGWELGRTITTIPGYHEGVRVPMQRLLGIRP